MKDQVFIVSTAFQTADSSAAMHALQVLQDLHPDKTIVIIGPDDPELGDLIKEEKVLGVDKLLALDKPIDFEIPKVQRGFRDFSQSPRNLRRKNKKKNK